MGVVTVRSEQMRAILASRRPLVEDVLARYAATNARVFGSVARGDAGPDSDIDLLVDLQSGGGNELLRVAGMSEELSEMLGVPVQVVAAAILREPVARGALDDAVAV